MIPSAITDLFEFHNSIFTKRSTMIPQTGPVELVFLHGYISNIEKEQEPIVFRIRREIIACVKPHCGSFALKDCFF